MIVLAKAPLRVSFFGGSSDIPEFYLNYGGGATISTAINKYVYVAVNKTPHKHIKLSYMKHELVKGLSDLEHDIVRETLRYYDIADGIEINTWADIPTSGSGLGGSSAFACALIQALNFMIEGTEIHPYQLAELASHIEIDRCRYKIGKQDQYASAFGGLNFIEYGHKCRVSALHDHSIVESFILVDTGIQRSASEVLSTVNVHDKFESICDLADMARAMQYEDPNNWIGAINDAWEIKKKTSSLITNERIDMIERFCRDYNSRAVKLLGAGGGGYMLVASPHNPVSGADLKRHLIKSMGLTVIKIKSEPRGARVVYHD